ncbi:PilZ domain-containing protein [Nitrospira japonica]|nr:PilZ domain-containing protein [Nitrospira japonica]
MERRRHRRVPAQINGLLCGNSHEVEGTTVDLSLGGAKIESGLEVYPGKVIVIRLMIPGVEEPVSIPEALVRWVEPNQFGVEFQRVDQKELDELEELLGDFEEAEGSGHA